MLRAKTGEHAATNAKKHCDQEYFRHCVLGTMTQRKDWCVLKRASGIIHSVIPCVWKLMTLGNMYKHPCPCYKHENEQRKEQEQIWTEQNSIEKARTKIRTP